MNEQEENQVREGGQIIPGQITFSPEIVPETRFAQSMASMLHDEFESFLRSERGRQVVDEVVAKLLEGGLDENSPACGG